MAQQTTGSSELDDALLKSTELIAQLGAKLAGNTSSAPQSKRSSKKKAKSKEKPPSKKQQEMKPNKVKKQKPFGVRPMMLSILRTLDADSLPKDLIEALQRVFKATWADRTYSTLGQGGKPVTIRIGVIGFNEVSVEFRRDLAAAFKRLRAVHNGQIPDGYMASSQLTALNTAIGPRWSKVEKTVVEKWLPEELADLNKQARPHG